MSGEDPLHYFRIEAHELVGALESGFVGYTGAPEGLAELFRLAHTLKGSARIVRQGTIADLAHAMEDVLAHHREHKSTLSRAEVQELLRVVDGMRSALRDVPPASEERVKAPVAQQEPRADQEFDAVRVGLSDMDALAAGVLEAQSHAEVLRSRVAELGELQRRLRTTAARSKHVKDQSLDDLATTLSDQTQKLASLADAIDVELRRLAQRTSVLRLLPSSAAFPELERAAHDAATQTDRSVGFVARGGAVRIDGHVLSAMRSSLLHLVRNAVAHGIEDESERLARGKNARGSVEVSVERRGARIAFTVKDDGRGVDRDAVRRVAGERGFAVPLDDDAVDRLVFEPGLSTAREVSDLSGRGVGLDAVQKAVERVGGQLEMRTERGLGTSFEIVVPVSLSSLRALVVSVSGRTLLVPLDTIVATARLEPSALLAVSNGRALVHEGVTLPFRALNSWLHPERDVSLGRVTVVVRTHRGNVAIGVDALRGTRDVIVRPLPRAAGASELIAGVALDGLGDPELVLDPEGLLGVPEAREKAKLDGSARKKPVLVIDDSLTTRMLEQSILDAAGYDVDVASSAEEGLQKALSRAYGLIVCDVEMPGMNGYEFTAETRKRESLRKIPVIMVTSLASEESRRRGREAGVSAYIVKGEFDQGKFLRTVSELLP